MASPDRAVYSQFPNGYYMRIADGAGPFAWNGTTMQLMGDGSFALTHRLLSAAGSVNSTLVRAGVGAIATINGVNAAAAVRYLKLYDKATAPTIGTDTPIATFHLLASVPFSFSFPKGLAVALGIGYGFTTAAADNSTAAVTAADIACLNISYQ